MKARFVISVGVVLLALSALVYFMQGQHRIDDPAAPEQWTCAMHPEILLPKPGLCPICGMELIPVSQGHNRGTGRQSLELSERARALAQVETSEVLRQAVQLQLRLYGALDFDESKLVHITARTRGRIERLYLDFTGISVEKGDHMVELYSPALISAQQELIQAYARLKAPRKEEPSAFLQRTLEDNLEAARTKLRLWGLSEQQISVIEQADEVQERLTINAPIGGVVVHKDAVEGRYVDEGTRIYTIADLSELWLVLDAYESDLTWLRIGQEVEFTAEALPGQRFYGMLSFIDPVLDETKRAVGVRANVENTAGRLKPGMFVRAVVKSDVDASGAVVSDRLEGKWVGRMHPQVVSDQPGNCPVCGMELVPAESLGYTKRSGGAAELPLLIPKTAALLTGKRAIVYVEAANMPGHYEAREVILGPRAGDWFVVYEGLAEGERVVTHGNFKIDSASQILAKPSMMRLEDQGRENREHQH